MKRYFTAITGNFLEHYDQALFGFIAPFLAPEIFPTSEPLQALIYTYALMPLGLLSRPLGALLFGWLGDRIGRKKTLSITLIGMALTTGMMGFFPPAAPLLWGLSRLLQNFFAAGEIPGGALYLLEETKNRTVWSSLYDASGILGILAASGAVFLGASFGIPWKYFFWFGFTTGIAGFLVRQTIEDQISESPKVNLWKYKKEIGTIASVSGFSYANYYMLTTFFNGFLPLVSPITQAEAIGMNTLLLFADLLLLPCFGWIAAKVGKEKLMLAGILLAIGSVATLLRLADGATFGAAILIRLSMTVFGVAVAAPFHAWAIETAPPQHRYLTIALGSAIGSRLLGAPAPAAALFLFQNTGIIEAAAIPTLLTALFAAAALSWKNLEVIENKVL